MKMVIIKDFDAPRNCVNCQNEGLSEIVGCGLFDECGKHPDCPFIEVNEQQSSDDCVSRASVKELFQEGCVMGMYDFLGIDDLSPVIPTHGTCKDCLKGHKYNNIDECYCDYLRDDVDTDFYCADFEKRGD